MNSEIAIDVLLGTLNGGEYIETFLESLAQQDNVLIRLVVSDDGSNDETLSIVKSYSHLFSEVIVLDGPRKGPSANYHFMLNWVKGPLVAFADQDDVWLPNHLENALRMLLDDSDLDLIVSRLVEFTSDGEWSIFPPLENFGAKPLMDIMQNSARGCGFVFRDRLLPLFKETDAKKSLMHDQKIYIICKSLGKVKVSSLPTVMYRLHSNQASMIGKSKYKLSRILNYRSNLQSIYNLSREIGYGHNLTSWGESLLEFANLVINPRNRLKLIKRLKKERLRSGHLENFVAKLLILTLKI